MSKECYQCKTNAHSKCISFQQLDNSISLGLTKCSPDASLMALKFFLACPVRCFSSISMMSLMLVQGVVMTMILEMKELSVVLMAFLEIGFRQFDAVVPMVHSDLLGLLEAMCIPPQW